MKISGRDCKASNSDITILIIAGRRVTQLGPEVRILWNHSGIRVIVMRRPRLRFFISFLGGDNQYKIFM